MQHNSTIAAPATPAISSALSIIRISGPDALQITQKIWQGKPLTEAKPRTAHLGYITDEKHNILDQVVATIFHAPASFTGEDMVEISSHGSPWITRAILRSLVKAGAQTAAPGEIFSTRIS